MKKSNISICPVIGITMGDAAGIGPEITAKIFSEKKLFDFCRPLVIGDARVMDKAISVTAANVKINRIKDISQACFRCGLMDVLHIAGVDPAEIKMGQVNAKCGKAAVEYVKKAGEMAMAGLIDATVSAPLNKEAMRAAGYHYEGQTQIFAELTDTKNYAMMLVMGTLRMFMVTNHMALREACDRITKEKVLSVIKLADRALRDMKIKEPGIAVSGLNPHAGEGGLFGKEEIEQIIPAIESAKRLGINAIGPVPPDAVFVQAKDGKYDAVLSMYHDHGTMAMKLLGFGSVVTVLVGLPIIRTSVGHGTAFDIAGQGVADESNLLEAVKMAAQIAGGR